MIFEERRNIVMSKSLVMAVISVFFLIFTLIIMYNSKLALIVSIFMFLASGGYSLFIKLREKKHFTENVD